MSKIISIIANTIILYLPFILGGYVVFSFMRTKKKKKKNLSLNNKEIKNSPREEIINFKIIKEKDFSNIKENVENKIKSKKKTFFKILIIIFLPLLLQISYSISTKLFAVLLVITVIYLIFLIFPVIFYFFFPFMFLRVFSILCKFAKQIKIIHPTKEEIEKGSKNLFNYNYIPWDLAEQKINYDELKNLCSDVEASYEILEKKPKLVKKHYLFSLGMGIILFFLFWEGSYIKGVLSGFLPIFIVYFYYKAISIDIIKLQIAKKNNWLYNPKPENYKGEILRKKYPEIFEKNSKQCFVEDEFWGVSNQLNNRDSIHFHIGLFEYYESNKKKINLNLDNLNCMHFYAFPLDKKLKTRFYLYQENTYSKLKNLFNRKEINTESIEFNKTFSFLYDGKKDERGLEIVKTLSPAVQEKLLKLNKEKDNCQILFSENVVIFAFDGALIKDMKTNFLKSIEIDNQDKEFVEKEILKLLEISKELSKYLN